LFLYLQIRRASDQRALQTEFERNAGLSRGPTREKHGPPKRAGTCQLRIGVAGLVVRHLGMLVILCGSLTLLAGFPTAALLLAGVRRRRLILLPGLALVRHAVSFLGNASTTACGSGSFLIRKNAARTAATMSA
jgi:hypothetical protein